MEEAMNVELMRTAGAKMANTMFNLAQKGGDLVGITNAMADSFKEMQQEWDAAVRAPSSAPTTGERQSIADDTEFGKLLRAYGNAFMAVALTEQPTVDDELAARCALIAHIDTWAARSAGEAVSLLREARAALETWKDVAPAVSLCADIDRFFAAPGNTATAQPTKAYITERAAEFIRSGCSTSALLSALPTEAETVAVYVGPVPDEK
jgi:hypothetical protein